MTGAVPEPDLGPEPVPQPPAFWDAAQIRQVWMQLRHLGRDGYRRLIAADLATAGELTARSRGVR